MNTIALERICAILKYLQFKAGYLEIVHCTLVQCLDIIGRNAAAYTIWTKYADERMSATCSGVQNESQSSLGADSGPRAKYRGRYTGLVAAGSSRFLLNVKI